MHEDCLLTLIDTLYDAVVSPPLWATFLQQTAEYMGGSSAWLSHIDLEARTGSGLVFGIDPAMQEQYFSYYNMYDPFTGYVGDARDHHYDRIVTDEDLIDKQDLMRSTFYAEFMQTIDVHSIAFVRLGRRGSQVKTLNINRSRARERFGSADMTHLRRIQSHVLRAVSLSERLAEMQISRPKGLPEPVMFMVDRDMRIHRESEGVDRWATSVGAVGDARGRLRVRDANMQERLAHLVRSTADRTHLGPRGGSLTYHPRVGAGPIEILVTPLETEAIGPFPTRATALVALRSIENRTHGIAERYGLTAAEAAVAQLLVAGRSPRDIARERGVSPLTVKTQMIHIMSKTGTHRQAEMVRTLMLAQP